MLMRPRSTRSSADIDCHQTMSAGRPYKARAIELLGHEPGTTALDVPCVLGDDVVRMQARGVQAVGADRSQTLIASAQLRHAGSGCEFVVADAADLSFADGSFDALRICRAFQHIADPGRIVREMARIPFVLPPAAALPERMAAVHQAIYAALAPGGGRGDAARAAELGRPGRFQLEAAIQSVHAQWAVSGVTDWPALLRLYEGLNRIPPWPGSCRSGPGKPPGRAEALSRVPPTPPDPPAPPARG
jgi:SAM-dependent methyltransferase